jgi:A/G-specific adenine glycosylase
VLARFDGIVPHDVNELLAIPGIGRYTAGAISSIAWRRKAPIVDGNIARILSRLAGIDEAPGSPALMRAAWREAERLVEVCRSPRKLNQGLMEIGALICTPRRPDCLACPLQGNCFAYAHKRTESLPRKKIRVETRDMSVSLYIVSDGNGRILMRRERGALMTAMLHLPHNDTSLLSGTPLRVNGTKLVAKFRHTITTRRVLFSVYSGQLAGSIHDDGDYEWIDPDQLSSIPHPSYVAKALAVRFD